MLIRFDIGRCWGSRLASLAGGQTLPWCRLTGDVFLFIICWFSAKINLLQSRSNVWQQEWTTLSGASENKIYKYINMNDKNPVNTHHNDSVVLLRYFLRVWPLTLAVPLVLSPQSLIHGDMFDIADIVYTSLFLASQSEMCFRAETCQAPHERDELQTLSWMRAGSITNSWHIAANTRRRGSAGRRWWPTWGNSPRRSLVSSRTSQPVSSKRGFSPRSWSGSVWNPISKKCWDWLWADYLFDEVDTDGWLLFAGETNHY